MAFGQSNKVVKPKLRMILILQSGQCEVIGNLADLVRICTIGISRNGRIKIVRVGQNNEVVLLKIISWLNGRFGQSNKVVKPKLRMILIVQAGQCEVTS